jgi:hypothetical protein
MRSIAQLPALVSPGAPSPSRPAQRRDRRIEVSAITRARTGDGERAVRIVGLSARTALLYAPEPIGWPGQTIDIDVPVLGGHDLSVMAGIARSERCRDGQAITVEFMIVDAEVRQKLNELLALLLAGEPDADGRQPRVVYDCLVAYGPTGAGRAHLQEISLAGLAMRAHERMPHDLVVDVTVPTLRGGAPIALTGRVTGQRLSAEGGYITTLDFEPLDGTRRQGLGTLVADLMCR